MAHIKFDYSKVLDKFVAPHEVDNLQAQVTVADEMIRKGTGPGADFLGWRDLPENYDREEFDRILKAAEKIKEESDVLVVIGIGGSYLGAKAAIDFLITLLTFKQKKNVKHHKSFMLGTLFHQLTSLTCLSMLKVKISQLTLSLNQEQQLNQLSLSVCSRNFLLRNTVKKKLTNVSTQQLTAKKVLLRLKQTLTVGKHLLFQMISVDASQY